MLYGHECMTRIRAVKLSHPHFDGDWFGELIDVNQSDDGEAVATSSHHPEMTAEMVL